MQHEIKGRARRAVPEGRPLGRIDDPIRALRKTLALARERNDPVFRKRLHFPGVRNPIPVVVLPESESFQFLAPQPPIVVVVQRGEGDDPQGSTKKHATSRNPMTAPWTRS